MKRIDINGQVHFDSCDGTDYTLCGLSMDGDSVVGENHGRTFKSVNCPDCVAIVLECKKIRLSDIDPEMREPICL